MLISPIMTLNQRYPDNNLNDGKRPTISLGKYKNQENNFCFFVQAECAGFSPCKGILAPRLAL